MNGFMENLIANLITKKYNHFLNNINWKNALQIYPLFRIVGTVLIAQKEKPMIYQQGFVLNVPK